MNNGPNVSIRVVQSVEDAIRQVQSRIQARAYTLFVERGATHGKDLDDWLAAKSELLREPFINLTETEEQIAVVLALSGFDSRELEVLCATDKILVQNPLKLFTEQEPNARQTFKLIHLPRPVDPNSLQVSYKGGSLKFTVGTADSIPVARATSA